MCGMSYNRNNDSPCFFLDVSLDCRKDEIFEWQRDWFGSLHDIILDRKPGLKDLIPFHGWSQNGLPLNYLQNTVRHYLRHKGCVEIIGGASYKVPEDESWTCFCRNTLLEDEEDISFLKAKDEPLLRDWYNQNGTFDRSKLPLLQWLEGRKSLLQSKFHETMKRFDIEYITQGEIATLNAG